ncbi:MAG: hypothetical protein KatS3mg110_1897 [Pirellulaceae bacterium]|nr:MAG: hypothetical protein KatS3mg110_1897 [Pirellulaceae bacterium]
MERAGVRSGARSGFFLVLVVQLVGCARGQLTESKWIQVWPPVESSAGDSAARAPTPEKLSATQSMSDSDDRPQAPEAGLDTSDDARPPADGTETEPRLSVAVQEDNRLSGAQRQLLTQQLALFQQSTTPPTAPSENEGASGSGRNEAPSSLAHAPNAAVSATASTRRRPSQESARPAPDLAAIRPAEREISADHTPSASTGASPPSLTGSQADNRQDTTKAGTAQTSSSSPPTVSQPSAPPASSSASTSSDGSREAERPTSDSRSSAADETTSANTSSESDWQSGQWRRDLERTIESLRRELQQSMGGESSERQRLEATLRLFYVVAQQRDESVRPIDGIDQQTGEFWKLAAAGLYELLDPNGSPVPDRRNKLALRYFREAVHYLAAASSLDVRNLALCRRVDSFGQYVEFEPYVFKPEQEVILYVEVANFAVEQTADGYETEFQGSYQILDSAGRRIADYDLPLDKQTCRNIRTDYFLPYRIFLPKNLAGGSYKIQVTIEDKKGKKYGQSPPVAITIRQ